MGFTLLQGCSAYLPEYYKFQTKEGTYIKVTPKQSGYIYEFVVAGNWIFAGTWEAFQEALKDFTEDVIKELFKLIKEWVFGAESGEAGGLPNDLRDELIKLNLVSEP